MASSLAKANCSLFLSAELTEDPGALGSRGNNEFPVGRTGPVHRDGRPAVPGRQDLSLSWVCVDDRRWHWTPRGRPGIGAGPAASLASRVLVPGASNEKTYSRLGDRSPPVDLDTVVCHSYTNEVDAYCLVISLCDMAGELAHLFEFLLVDPMDWVGCDG